MVVKPSNVPQLSSADGLADLVVSHGADLELNTDTGEVTLDGTELRAAGTGVVASIAFNVINGLGVFTLASLEIEQDGVLRAHGSNALVLLVDGDVTIRGLVDVSAGACPDGTSDSRCGGPGAGAGGADGPGGGCGGGGKGADAGDTGGGGGALGKPGAPGGDETADGLPFNGSVGGAGGSTSGCPSSTLVPLKGGSGGGSGGGPGGEGGGGGGAIQITAFRGTLQIAGGQVRASGAGGKGLPSLGGGGGGSGGGILLEAAAIELDGATLAANGGGGGEGNGTAAGASGLLDDGSAPGGSSTGHAGGHGGAKTSGATEGEAASSDTGGGGGGVGRIRVNTLTGSATSSDTTVSPAASFGVVSLRETVL